MDFDFVIKAAGIGMLVAVTCQILSRIGREDQSSLVSLAGIVALLLMLINEIASLVEAVRGIFGI
ncbi:MAG: stage III sporulation protein AC [Ruminococcaceae bacterium]|nr:stage III sporulation protein AC [Oscillospiraceae bacterium]